MKKIFKILLFPVVIISMLLSLINLISSAQNTNIKENPVLSQRPENVLCYRVSSPAPIQKDLKDLQEEFKNLEQLHKQGKISEDTYQARKTSLEKQINEINK